MIENRAVGIKSREVYEAPGAIALITAHSALEDVVLTKDEARIKRPLEQRWTELVYEGLWFSPAREAIDAFVDDDAGARHRRGPARAAAERRGRHRPALADTCSTPSSSRPTAPGETFPHEAAEGFIRDRVARDRAPRCAGARREQGIIAG